MCRVSSTPHHTAPHHTTPHHTTPHHTAPHHTTLHHTAPHHTTPHHTTPHQVYMWCHSRVNTRTPTHQHAAAGSAPCRTNTPHDPYSSAACFPGPFHQRTPSPSSFRHCWGPTSLYLAFHPLPSFVSCRRPLLDVYDPDRGRGNGYPFDSSEVSVQHAPSVVLTSRIRILGGVLCTVSHALCCLVLVFQIQCIFEIMSVDAPGHGRLSRQINRWID